MRVNFRHKPSDLSGHELLVMEIEMLHSAWKTEIARAVSNWVNPALTHEDEDFFIISHIDWLHGCTRDRLKRFGEHKILSKWTHKIYSNFRRVSRCTRLDTCMLHSSRKWVFHAASQLLALNVSRNAANYHVSNRSSPRKFLPLSPIVAFTLRYAVVHMIYEWKQSFLFSVLNWGYLNPGFGYTR